MAHEADRGFTVVVFLRRLCDGVRHAGEIVVRREQRRAQGDALKGVGVACEGVRKIVVLKAVHQVGRLHDKGLDPVFDCAVQGLLHIVDELPIAASYMVDDDLARKAAAYAPVGEGGLQRALDPADSQAAAVVVARAEAHDQKLLLADAVLVARVIKGGVAGLIVLIVLLRGLGEGAQARHGEEHRKGQQKGKQFFHGFLLYNKIIFDKPISQERN